MSSWKLMETFVPQAHWKSILTPTVRSPFPDEVCQLLATTSPKSLSFIRLVRRCSPQTAADEVGEFCILAPCSGADDDLQVTFPSLFVRSPLPIGVHAFLWACGECILPHDFEGALGSKEPSRFPVSRTQVSNQVRQIETGDMLLG